MALTANATKSVPVRIPGTNASSAVSKRKPAILQPVA